MTITHPDFESEQKYIAAAYDLLDQGLVDAEQNFRDFQPAHKATAHAIHKAFAILKESRGSGQLVFGRIDADDDPLYIGRRRVYDRSRNLKVAGMPLRRRPTTKPRQNRQRASNSNAFLWKRTVD